MSFRCGCTIRNMCPRDGRGDVVMNDKSCVCTMRRLRWKETQRLSIYVCTRSLLYTISGRRLVIPIRESGGTLVFALFSLSPDEQFIILTRGQEAETDTLTTHTYSLSGLWDLFLRPSDRRRRVHQANDNVSRFPPDFGDRISPYLTTGLKKDMGIISYLQNDSSSLTIHH